MEIKGTWNKQTTLAEEKEMGERHCFLSENNSIYNKE